MELKTSRMWPSRSPSDSREAKSDSLAVPQYNGPDRWRAQSALRGRRSGVNIRRVLVQRLQKDQRQEPDRKAKSMTPGSETGHPDLESASVGRPSPGCCT